MLHYPKIPGSSAAPVGKCVAFEKLDGTNLHWCWERDFGWHAFGTRRDEFNLTPDGVAQFKAAHPGLEESAPVFLATLAEPLDALLREHDHYSKFAAARAFTEFLGAESLAGAHPPGAPQRARRKPRTDPATRSDLRSFLIEFCRRFIGLHRC